MEHGLEFAFLGAWDSISKPGRGCETARGQPSRQKEGKPADRKQHEGYCPPPVPAAQPEMPDLKSLSVSNRIIQLI